MGLGLIPEPRGEVPPALPSGGLAGSAEPAISPVPEGFLAGGLSYATAISTINATVSLHRGFIVAVGGVYEDVAVMRQDCRSSAGLRFECCDSSEGYVFKLSRLTQAMDDVLSSSGRAWHLLVVSVLKPS